MAYPPPGQPLPPTQDPLWPFFSHVAGADGQIDADELQRCLTQSGISGSYQPFSKETCVIMINMLDRDFSGQMGFTEFKELWGVLNQWKTTFMTFDRDRSGTVEPHELQQALTTFGYRLSPQALAGVVRRFSTNSKIGFDQFVGLCVKLRLATTQFQARDTQRNGTATFAYDDFIQVVMSA